MTPGSSRAPPRCAARHPAPRWGRRCNPSPAVGFGEKTNRTSKIIHIIHQTTARCKVFRIQVFNAIIPVCQFVAFKMFFSLCGSHNLGKLTPTASLPCVSGLLRPVGHVYCQGPRRSLHCYNGAGQPARTAPFAENLKSSHAVVNCWTLATHGILNIWIV